MQCNKEFKSLLYRNNFKLDYNEAFGTKKAVAKHIATAEESVVSTVLIITPERY